MDFYEELEWRGLIHSATEGLRDHLGSRKVTGYIGFDPTASSLHVGSLLPLMALARFQRAGHTPIAILGGATGRIGDPSGKITERPVLSLEELEKNLEGIAKQIAMFVDIDAEVSPGLILDNSQWLTDIRYLDFLRDIGRHFRINQMLNRDAVKMRLERETGMTYAEFSYNLLQAYDYLVLHEEYGCTLQMGGSDQWGNIVSGIDLVRRVLGMSVFGLVSPLVTTTSGSKFGKTEAGTVWLDAGKTSPFEFFQFWLNTNHADVVQYLKYFTWLPKPEIDSLEDSLRSQPEARLPHRALAREVTKLIHGEEAAVRAESAAKLLFREIHAETDPGDVEELLRNVPSFDAPASLLDDDGVPVLEIIVDSGLLRSKGEARRLIAGGGFYINGSRVEAADRILTSQDLTDGGLIILRKGRKQYFVLRFL